MAEPKDHILEAQETLDALVGLRDLLKPGAEGGYGLTLEGVARDLGVSEATVRSWTGTYHADSKRFLGGKRLPTGARELAVRRYVARKFTAWKKDFKRRHPSGSWGSPAPAALE